jgi:hypothetical protein
MRKWKAISTTGLIRTGKINDDGCRWLRELRPSSPYNGMTIDSCRRLCKVDNILQRCEGQYNEKEEVFMRKGRNKSIVFTVLIVGIIGVYYEADQ